MNEYTSSIHPPLFNTTKYYNYTCGLFLFSALLSGSICSSLTLQNQGEAIVWGARKNSTANSADSSGDTPALQAQTIVLRQLKFLVTGF